MGVTGGTHVTVTVLSRRRKAHAALSGVTSKEVLGILMPDFKHGQNRNGLRTPTYPAQSTVVLATLASSVPIRLVITAVCEFGSPSRPPLWADHRNDCCEPLGTL